MSFVSSQKMKGKNFSSVMWRLLALDLTFVFVAEFAVQDIILQKFFLDSTSMVEKIVYRSVVLAL